MKDNKRLKRRVRNSYIVSTVSMALVLFLLGSVGYLMTAALRVARTLQESVTVTVELADGVDSLRRGEIERRLRGDEMVRDIEFVSKQTKDRRRGVPPHVRKRDRGGAWRKPAQRQFRGAPLGRVGRLGAARRLHGQGRRCGAWSVRPARCR